MSSGEPSQAKSFEELDPETPDGTAQDARAQMHAVNITHRLNVEKIMVSFLLYRITLT
jgi:hypothetical protein